MCWDGAIEVNEGADSLEVIWERRASRRALWWDG